MWKIVDSTSPMAGACSRREILTVVSLPLLGLSLPAFFAQQTHAASKPERVPGFGRAKSIIFVYLPGGPSHIDMWDPKPDAPAEVRGEFRPIATAANGVLLSEVQPKLAMQADKFSIIRSLSYRPKGLASHGASIYLLMTGHDASNFSPTGQTVPPTRNDVPSCGSVISWHQPDKVRQLSYVAVCSPVLENVVVGVGQGAGLLGAAHDPFTMYDDPNQPLKLETYTLPGDVSLDRLQERVDLREFIEQRLAKSALHAPGRNKPAALAAFDEYYWQAISLVQSGRAVRAFQLNHEPASLRDLYGRTRFGQSCLLARRLVEAGTKFVQVTWPGKADDPALPGIEGSWDTHRNNFQMLRDHRCPVFDQSFAALIADLADRGLLESTLVVAIGEFGRTPKIGEATTNNVGPGGRDHWTDCYSAVVAGAGIQPGRVYGESDRWAAYPKLNPVHPYDLISTVFHAAGIDAETEYRDNLNRPRRLVEHGEAVMGLY